MARPGLPCHNREDRMQPMGPLRVWELLLKLSEAFDFTLRCKKGYGQSSSRVVGTPPPQGRESAGCVRA
eukprot:4074127-Lingulodinium_polyedra.AAC.1